MTSSQESSAASIAMAAAIAAAAELAKNGGMSSLYSQQQKKEEQQQHHWVTTTTPPPSTISPEPIAPTSEEEDDDDDEEDAEKRLARSRERNREHARRTRLRKKAQLEALQVKAKGLEEESLLLKQSVEECSIASILLDISSSSHNSVTTSTLVDVASHDQNATKPLTVVGGKRKRFVSDEHTEMTPQPLKLRIDGQVTLIGGGGTHINWKTGVYCGENGQQRKLTQEQLESLRRERNRMHAKMTRDRKKYFISSIEKTIQQLETSNQKMRHALLEVAKHHPSCVTPVSSPLVLPQKKQKVVPHGFSLTAQ